MSHTICSVKNYITIAFNVITIFGNVSPGMASNIRVR